MIESVKKAEDNDSVVIRLYESKGSTDTIKIKFNFDYKKVVETTFMEKEINEINCINSTVELTFKPYEIRTIVVK
jgi:alpha-mannosidase